MTAAPHSIAMTTEELFRQHAAFVGRFLARLGVPAEHIPDALQEVFLVVHRQGGYRPGIAKPTSYLAGIALHAARKHRRREQVDRARRSETGADQLATGGADPIRRMQVQQDLERLQCALDHLSEEHRTALVLIEIEGESCLSVAAALGVPVGTMYSRVHVARKKLQLALRRVDEQRPTPSRGRRMERAPSLSMFAWFGLDALFRSSEAERLLQVAREQPPATEGADALLARHRELVRGGAELPSWAAHYVPHSATWVCVLSLGPVATVTSLMAAGVVAAVVIAGAPVASPAQPMAAAPTPTNLATVAQPSAADAPATPMPIVAATATNAAKQVTLPVDNASNGASPSPRAAFEHAARSSTEPTAVRVHARAADVEPRASTRTRTIGADPRADAADAEPSAPASSRAFPDGDTRTAASSQATSRTTARAETVGRTRTRASQNAAPRAGAADGDARTVASSEAASRPTARTRAADDRTAAEANPETPQPTAAAPIRLPTPMPSDDRPVDSMQEMRDVASAEHLLSSDPARALQVARAIRERFPEGYLREERAYVEVMALVKLARTEEAGAEADAFLRRYPDGPYSQRVRSALQGATH